MKKHLHQLLSLTFVQCLLLVVTTRYWPLYQVHVKNVFLNGDLKEEVYTKPPHGHDHPRNQVCQLCRSFYGLKQVFHA